MLGLTENAVSAITEILERPSSPEGAGVRIASSTPTADVDGLQLGLADAPKPTDTIVEEGGARVFVQDAAVGLLQDKVLDADREGDLLEFSVANSA